MARRRKGDLVDGWLILDKRRGLGSTEAVSAARRLLRARKAGHAGTLDPMATGVLPIAFGEATKTVPYVMDGRKRYRFTVRWGEARDTDDAEGRVVETSAARPDQAAVEAALPAFIGVVEQVPPAFSAIKVDGERAYDIARDEGADAVTLAPRRVEIDSLELTSMDADGATFAAACGKGTYMRALARDIARAVGTVGHVVDLRRTRVGPFDESDAISLEWLESNGHSAALSALLPVETGLDGIPAFSLDKSEAARMRCGQPVSLMTRADRDRVAALLDSGPEGVSPGDMVRAMTDGRLLAIARFEAGALHPVRVLNVQDPVNRDTEGRV